MCLHLYSTSTLSDRLKGFELQVMFLVVVLKQDFNYQLTYHACLWTVGGSWCCL